MPTAAAPKTAPALPLKLCAPVRSRLPELPIDYKLAVRQEDPHYGNAGVLESELGIFVPLLVEAGVTSFHVTLANHSSLEDTIPPANHPYFKGEGCFLKFCDEVRQYTDKPITGVGGLTNPDFVEAAAGQRPHHLRRHEPPTAGRPCLAQQGCCRAGAGYPPLCALQ